MLFWTFIGIVYANIVNFEFITRILMDFNLLSILSFIAPLIAWAFGVLHQDFGAVFISTVLIGAFGYASFLVKIHSRSFLTGVTQGEINRLICKLIYQITQKFIKQFLHFNRKDYNTSNNRKF